MKKGPPQEEPAERVALWVISFTDMITLMLAFFVMLQTLAKEKSGILFKAGQGSFVRAIEGFGIPDLIYGQQKVSNVDFKKIRYPTAEAAEEAPTGRVIDADGDALRKGYDDIRRLMENRATDMPRQALNVTVTPIRFGADATLGPEATEYLGNLMANLRNDMPAGSYRIYVLGLAADRPSLKEQLTVSAERARSVENYLRTRFPTGEAMPDIYSIGEGAGGAWGAGTAASGKTAVVLVIMGAGANG
jgi:outer membrane protein OmpA-like peptidoglycan-associated protein